MKKLLTLAVAIAMLATACGSDTTSIESVASAATDSAAAEPEAAIDTGADNSDAGDDLDDSGDTGSTAPASAESTVALPDGAKEVGGFLIVDQIESTPREDVASALDTQLNLDFPEPLIDVNRILSGGPPPDGIPPIDTPTFEHVPQVDWLQDQEPVLAITVDGIARAYPIQIMTWHELVNDTFGDIPVTISYCPLCNSALAYDRRVGDRILDFGTSGRLFNSSLVMYDRQTESLWTHFNGQAVVGQLTGTQLDLLPIQTTSWAQFRETSPNALVLSRDTGFSRDYGRNPYQGYDNPEGRAGFFDGELDERLPAKARVVAIRHNDVSIAVELDALIEKGVLSGQMGDDLITAWNVPGTSTPLEANTVFDGRDVGATGAFLSAADGQQLTFMRVDGDRIVDEETGSTWNIFGQAIDGELAGTQLQAIEHLDTFWFAIAAFEPDTIIVNQ